MTEELLALLVEQFDAMQQMFIATHGGKPRRTPFEIPRPWRRSAERPKPRTTRVEDVARAFGMSMPPVSQGTFKRLGKRTKKE